MTRPIHVYRVMNMETIYLHARSSHARLLHVQLNDTYFMVISLIFACMKYICKNVNFQMKFFYFLFKTQIVDSELPHLTSTHNIFFRADKRRRVFVYLCLDEALLMSTYEPRREKTGFLHMRKQRRRSASR